jgi:predicted phosphodiesterase
MRLHILSDLHIEFGDIKLPKVSSDIIVLAGDIHIGTKGLNWIKNKFKNKKVIYVLGNHEYYYNIIPELADVLKRKSEGTNIHVLENEELVIDNVVFLCCTLWTDFKLYDDTVSAINCSKSMMNDYKLIRVMPGYRYLDTSDVIDFHEESFEWLNKKVKEHCDKKIVIVTHNGPSIKSCLPIYKNDLLTASFVSNLEGFIKKSNISLWIHGHTHNSADYMVGDTRIICNPRGYYRDFDTNENVGFKYDLTIKV